VRVAARPRWRGSDGASRSSSTPSGLDRKTVTAFLEGPRWPQAEKRSPIEAAFGWEPGTISGCSMGSRAWCRWRPLRMPTMSQLRGNESNQAVRTTRCSQSCGPCARTSTPCPAGWRGSSPVPNPWVALMARPDLILHRAAIAEPARYYDGERAIVVRRGLLLEDERRYLWHELVHADRRDRACHHDARADASVDREAVRRAIPTSSLMWAADKAQDWCRDGRPAQAARAWVRWRVQIAHPAERGTAPQEQRGGQHEPHGWR
jgi:hypothetical protein